MSPRPTRTMLPFIAVSAGMLITGLLLGAGRDSDDTSMLNTASKVLLTVGLLALIASLVAEAVRRRRSRPSGTDVRQIP